MTEILYLVHMLTTKIISATTEQTLTTDEGNEMRLKAPENSAQPLTCS